MFMWTGAGPAPIELIQYRLCKMFSCLPSDLNREDPEDLTAMLVCAEIENRTLNPVRLKRSARGR